MIFSTIDLKLARLVGMVFGPWHRRAIWLSRLFKRTTAVDTELANLKPITVITGASGGIGAAIALELGGAELGKSGLGKSGLGAFGVGRGGHDVLLIGQNEERLKAVADQVREISDASDASDIVVLTLSLDLIADDCCEMIDQLLGAQGFYVARLINNAGIGELDDFLSSDFKHLKQVMDLNIEVLTRLTHRYLPGMVARGNGAIINMASIGGLAPGPYQSVYYASKAYVINFSEALAHEVRGRGVYVAAILPGPTKTPFHRKIGGQKGLYIKLLGQMKPERVARCVHRALLMRHWAVVTPGIIYTVLSFCMRVIPSSLLVPLMGILYKKR